MSEYQASTTVNALAQEVFQFVSDPESMPRYLPTVHAAQCQGPDRVRVQGEAAGHSYDYDGWFRADSEAMTMEWGSDGENRYSGDLRVRDNGESCYVTVHLMFEPRPDQDEAFREQMGSRDRTIQDGLEKSLESIRNICEGTGDKVPSQAETGRARLL